MLQKEVRRGDEGKGGSGERCVNIGWKGRPGLAMVMAAETGSPCG